MIPRTAFLVTMNVGREQAHRGPRRKQHAAEAERQNLLKPEKPGPGRRWRVLAGSLILLLAGCTTYVARVQKDEAYGRRLTETTVVWVPPESKFETRIIRTGVGFHPVVTEKDKSESRAEIRELMALFTTSAPGAMRDGLRSAGVSLTPQGTRATTRLRIQPTSATTDCAALGCQHSLWLWVALDDRSEQKTVWSGSFKVGAPFPTRNDESVVKSFTESVIAELRRSGLL